MSTILMPLERYPQLLIGPGNRLADLSGTTMCTWAPDVRATDDMWIEVQNRFQGVSDETSPIAVTGFRPCRTTAIQNLDNYKRVDETILAGQDAHELTLYVGVQRSATYENLLNARGPRNGWKPGHGVQMLMHNAAGMVSSPPGGVGVGPHSGTGNGGSEKNGRSDGNGGGGGSPGGGPQMSQGDGSGSQPTQQGQSGSGTKNGEKNRRQLHADTGASGPPAGDSGGSGPPGGPSTSGPHAASDDDELKFVAEPWNSDHIVMYLLPEYVGVVDTAAEFESMIRSNQISVIGSKGTHTNIQMTKAEQHFLTGNTIDSYRIHSSSVAVEVDPISSVGYRKYLELQANFTASDWSEVLGFPVSPLLLSEIDLMIQTKMRIASSTDSIFSVSYQSLRVDRLVQTEKMTWEELIGGIGGWLSILWGASLHLILFHRGNGLVIYLISLVLATAEVAALRQASVTPTSPHADEKESAPSQPPSYLTRSASLMKSASIKRKSITRIIQES